MLIWSNSKGKFFLAINQYSVLAEIKIQKDI